MFGDLVVNLVAKINRFTQPMGMARNAMGQTVRSVQDGSKQIAAAVKASQAAQRDAEKSAFAYTQNKGAADAERIARVNAMNGGRPGMFSPHRGVMANQTMDLAAAKKTQSIIAQVRAAGGALRTTNPLPKVVAQSEGWLARLQAAFMSARGGIGTGVSGIMSAMSGLLRMGPIGAAVAAALLVIVPAVAAFGAIKWGTQQLLEAEKAQTSFAIMLGSGSQATAMLGDLKKYGRETGYGVGIQKAAETMLAFGVSANSVQPAIRAIGDIARGDTQRLESLSLAFSQSSAAGRLMGQDLLQMVNAGFNPLQEISRKTGENLVELKKRMEDGKVPFSEVQAAFISATSEGGKFHGMMDAIKGTMGGQINILLANFGELVKEVTAGLLEGFDLQEALTTLNYWLETARGNLSEWMPELHMIGEVARFAFDVIVSGVTIAFAFMNQFRKILESVLGVFIKIEKVKPPAIGDYAKQAAAAREAIGAAPPVVQPPKAPEVKQPGPGELRLMDGSIVNAAEHARKAQEAKRETELKAAHKSFQLQNGVGSNRPDLFFEANSREDEPINAKDSVNDLIDRNKLKSKADKVNEEFAATNRAADKAAREKRIGDMKPAKESGAIGVRTNEAYKAIVAGMNGGKGATSQEKQVRSLERIAKSNDEVAREAKKQRELAEKNQDQVLETI